MPLLAILLLGFGCVGERVLPHPRATLRLPPHPDFIRTDLPSHTLASNGDWLLAGVGSSFDPRAPAQRAAVLAYEWDSPGWRPRAVLRVPIRHPSSVDLLATDGCTAAVGLGAAGRVLVFERHLETWSPVRTLPVRGTSVAVQRNTLVIGRPTHPGKLASAEVYERRDGRWVHASRLGADEGWWGFGSAVAVAADQIVVGAPGRVGDIFEPGVVVAFEREHGTWRAHQVLRAEPPTRYAGFELGDSFGESLSAHGTRLAVLACDRVFIYELIEGRWQLDGAIDLERTDMPRDVALSMGPRRLVTAAVGMWGLDEVRTFARADAWHATATFESPTARSRYDTARRPPLATNAGEVFLRVTGLDEQAGIFHDSIFVLGVDG